MKAGVKVVLGAILVIVAAAALLALFADARRRSRISHCRNNLRHIGGLAARNWGALDPARTGRAFWQQVREMQYRDVRGAWRPLNPDPFACPVLGRADPRPGDPESIDYRGPLSVRERLEETPRDEPIGADRPGNHPSGGHVLFLDTSVQEIPAVVEAADAPWQKAAPLLGD